MRQGEIADDLIHQKITGKCSPWMQNHLNERIPVAYNQCILGINEVLKMAWDIANRDNYSAFMEKSLKNNDISDSLTENEIDERVGLQALALANDCYKYRMDLVTNGVVITDAIKFVQQKKGELAKVSENKDNGPNKIKAVDTTF